MLLFFPHKPYIMCAKSNDLLSWYVSHKEVRFVLTDLVVRFLGFLQPDTPLVVEFDANVRAAVRVFAHPAEKLLKLLS